MHDGLVGDLPLPGNSPDAVTVCIGFLVQSAVQATRWRRTARKAYRIHQLKQRTTNIALHTSKSNALFRNDYEQLNVNAMLLHIKTFQHSMINKVQKGNADTFGNGQNIRTWVFAFLIL